MKHTIDWVTGVLIALALFLAVSGVVTWLYHINKLLEVAKPILAVVD